MSSLFSQEKIDKLADKLGVFVTAASEKVKEVTEKTLNKDTPLEKNLKEATSDKNWGCATTVLSEIAQCSFNCTDYLLIMKFMWSALAEPPKKWRRIFKALTLLEYLLKNGNDRVVEDTRENQFALRVLQQFSFTEEGRDKGAGIREKAKLICRLAFDPELLKEERETAQKNRNKYVGIGARGECTSFSSAASISSATSFSSAPNSFSSFNASNKIAARARAGDVHTAGRPFGPSRSAAGALGSTTGSGAKGRDGRGTPRGALDCSTTDGASAGRRSPTAEDPHGKGAKDDDRKSGSTGKKKKNEKEDDKHHRRRQKERSQITPSDDLLALDEDFQSATLAAPAARVPPVFSDDSLFGNDDNWSGFTAASSASTETAAKTIAAGASAAAGGGALPFELFPAPPAPWSAQSGVQAGNQAADSSAANDLFGGFQAAPPQSASGGAAAVSSGLSSLDFFAAPTPTVSALPQSQNASLAGGDKNPFSAPPAPAASQQRPTEGFFADSAFATFSMNVAGDGAQPQNRLATGDASMGRAALSVAATGLPSTRSPQQAASFGAASASPASSAFPAASPLATATGAAPAAGPGAMPNLFPAPQAATPSFYGQAPVNAFGGGAQPAPSLPTFPLQPAASQSGAAFPAFPQASSAPFFGAQGGAGAGAPAAGAFGAFQAAPAPAPLLGALSAGAPAPGGMRLMSPFPGAPAPGVGKTGA
ncbi:ENTH domain-containing protein [Besnoitia besnoiti]|uniref:ENTH domain-containing protein n=1 Tax=Besnoitia besnoiti TaxID=94643 RepID=A0A2A9MIV2_BESBE|nr:ENTH domain-containing protein [Besnoitia besnoiti]PFH37124.1 ENTH domain-containing protein [Besnoitia besnoiti]